ncbi:MAG: hypothetical protein WD929_08890 [Steroidobacteraceae bacterium]
MFNPSMGRVMAAAVGALLCMPALAQTPAATGPWAKVPPLSTACYQGTDPFVARLDAALTAVNAARTRQQAANQTIEDEYQRIEPMEMASRMQQWMMSNPQAAMKYMQGVQAVGEDFHAKSPAINTATMRFSAEEKDLIKRYQAALKAAYAPAQARHNALKTKIGTPVEYPSVKDPGTPGWAMAEEDVIMGELDQAYAALCPQWWGATAPIHAWLKTYRTWLTQEWVPYADNLGSQNAQTYAIMGTPSASWRATSAEEAAIKYLEAAQRLFAERREKPRCSAGACTYF